MTDPAPPRSHRSGEPPTIYATLREDAIGPNLRYVDEKVRELLQRVARQITEGVRNEMEAAYGQGLAHGFQQGVQAECKRREAQDDTSA